MKFPDAKCPPGPSIRAGDFAEILIADYAEHKLGYWCPRQFRYDMKWSRNESTKGCDVIGFRCMDGGNNPDDEMFVFEAKAALTGTNPVNRLQDAVNDSAKDLLREATTLNALKQRFLERGDIESAKRVQRYQNMSDRPFRRISGAAAVLVNEMADSDLIAKTTIQAHHNPGMLKLILVKGSALMSLAHTLYELAANEA